MSWLARSLANSLRLDDDEEFSDMDVALPRSVSCEMKSSHGTIGSNEAQGRGVKDDLTELKQTLSRQLRGVANFLAPNPSSDRDLSTLRDRGLSVDHDLSSSGEEEVPDTVDVGSPLYGLVDRDYEQECVATREEELGFSHREVSGITDEVLAFARNIAMHPETWIDFPLDEEDILHDLEMSDAQQEHVLTIESLAPRLAALRIELCPCHMSASYFWLVYFVLLQSRLSKHDAEFLYTPQVMEARARWMRELHKQRKDEDESNFYSKSTHGVIHEDLDPDKVLDCNQSMIHETERQKTVAGSSDALFVDKSVINEKLFVTSDEKIPLNQPKAITELDDHYNDNDDNDDDDDGWLEEDSDLDSCYKSTLPLGNEEEISFSDLEDDATCTNII